MKGVSEWLIAGIRAGGLVAVILGALIGAMVGAGLLDARDVCVLVREQPAS